MAIVIVIALTLLALVARTVSLVVLGEQLSEQGPARDDDEADIERSENEGFGGTQGTWHS